MLKQKQLLIDDLSLGPQSYMGICKVNTKGRRIDIKMIPEKSWISALVYFTGSFQLNIRMRQKAMENGWNLNEKGLFIPGTNDQIFQINFSTEKELFQLLDIEYLKPEDR